jgi:hypothetical protein
LKAVICSVIDKIRTEKINPVPFHQVRFSPKPLEKKKAHKEKFERFLAESSYQKMITELSCQKGSETQQWKEAVKEAFDKESKASVPATIGYDLQMRNGKAIDIYVTKEKQEYLDSLLAKKLQQEEIEQHQKYTNSLSAP